MGDRIDNEEEEIVIPKMKAVSKPKNLKKRKREIETSDEEDGSKKPKSEEEDVDSGISKLDELKMLQQARANKLKGADMSSEGVKMSTMSGGGADGSSIASLTSHFTGQRAKVNTLDTRMEEFIEQEMAKRKADRALSGNSNSSEANASDPPVPAEEEPVEVDEDEEESKRLHELSAPSKAAPHPSSTHDAPSKSTLPAPITGVIDLSNANLRATSSTQSAPAPDHNAKRWHKHDGPIATSGILEIDLPVEEQLRMYEATRQAALEALKNQKKKRSNRTVQDDFGDLTEADMAVGNLAADFSKHKKSTTAYGGRATDIDALDKYKKRQAQMFR